MISQVQSNPRVILATKTTKIQLKSIDTTRILLWIE